MSPRILLLLGNFWASQFTLRGSNNQERIVHRVCESRTYLNCSAGVDLLLVKATPLLAMLVLQKWRTNCYLSVERKPECALEDVMSRVTFSMLLWCFCSLSRSVGSATLRNLWMGDCRRLSVSLLPSSAMCPADCPQPTPLWYLDLHLLSLFHCPHRHCEYQRSMILMNT